MRILRAVWAALLLGAAPAAALTVDFEDAAVSGGAVSAGGAWAAPTGREGVTAGGALRVARGLDGRAPGLSGAALSTRDLAWPYGFSVRLPEAAAAASAVWAAGDRDWRVQGLDEAGAAVAEAAIGAGAAGFALSAEAGGGGFRTLLFESLDGYDWIYLDDLRWEAAPDAAPAPRSITFALVASPPGAPGTEAVVPLPAGAALAASAFAALFGWLGVMRRRRAG